MKKNRFKSPRQRQRMAALRCAALAVGLLVAAPAGATTVTTLSGGPTAFNGSSSGYADGDTGADAQFDFPSGLAFGPSDGSLFVADCSNNAVRWISNLSVGGTNSAATNSQTYTFAGPNLGIDRPVAVAMDGATNLYVLNRGDGRDGDVLEFTNVGLFMQFPEPGAQFLAGTNVAHLTNATALALDGLTNLYVTCNSNTVLRVTPAGVVSVVGVITNAVYTNVASGVATVFTNVGVTLCGVTVMNDGQLALADAGNNGIWLMSPGSGAATPFTGFHGAGDTNGPPFLAAFNHPEDIAKADGGWLVVADRYNNKVKTIDASGNVYRLFGVNSNYWVTSGDGVYPGWWDGPVSAVEEQGSEESREPFGIAVASDGTVFDTEVYYHLIRYATGTGLTNTNGLSTTQPPLFNQPAGLALDAAGADLFIADKANNAVKELNFANNQTTNYLTGADGLDQPVDVAMDAANDLYVLNQGTGGNGSILEFDPFRNLLATNATGLSRPTAFTLDGSGDLFVAEQGGAVQEFVSGASNTLATVTQPGVQLQGIALFDDGTLIVSDAGNHVIWQINPVTKAVSLFSGKIGAPGDTLGSTNFARFDSPRQIIRAGGDLALVADSGNNRVVVMNRSGAVTNVLVSTNSEVWFGRPGDPAGPDSLRFVPMTTPVGLALGSGGEVFSSEDDYNNIRETLDTGLSQPGTGGGGSTTNVVVAAPTLTPNSGYYPMGQTITVQSPNPDVHYTTDGTAPTTNSPAVALVGNVGFIHWFGTTNDLTALRVRAFVGTNASVIVSGQPVGANTIGTPTGFHSSLRAGIGSTIIVPVVCNLRTNVTVRSFQFRYEVAPQTVAGSKTNTPALQALSMDTNDFVQLVTAVQSGKVGLFSTNGYSVTNGLGIVTNGLEIVSISNIVFQYYAVAALIEVEIPDTAAVGDTYSLNVLYPSATSDGYSAPVPLTPMPATTILVTNIPYTVGDSASDSGTWYNAGTFGDGNLDNADVNQVAYASVGLRVPFLLTDIFNDMDVYPPDVPGGLFPGNGQITFLDWQTVLARSLRLDTNDWSREWTPGGFLVSLGRTNLVVPQIQQAAPLAKPLVVPSPWYRQALVGGDSVGHVAPGGTVHLPVYVTLQHGSTLEGLQFRVVVTPENGAPPLTDAPQLNPASGIPTPSLDKSFKAGETGFGWSLVPGPSFNFASASSNFLGWVNFTVPAAAQSGQTYRVSFANADGAPDLNTPYTFETRSAFVTVGAAAPPASICSDEWKARFFGGATNALAADSADADGDGVPNWMEYLAGTDPTDPYSKLQFLDAGKETVGGRSQMEVQWRTAPGKAYEVQWATNLAGGAWNTLQTVSGNGAVAACVDTNNSGGARYYRLRLLP